MIDELILLENKLISLKHKINKLRATAYTVNDPLVSVKINPNQEKLFAIAGEELRDRSRRTAHFPDALLGEPAWDMMLDLYYHSILSQEISVTSACLAARVPVATGLRWIALLQSQGYITRKRSEKDRRSVILDLTADGRDRIERILTERLNRRTMSSNKNSL